MSYLSKLLKSLKEIIVVTILQYGGMYALILIYYLITHATLEEIENFVINYACNILLIFDIFVIIYLVKKNKRKEPSVPLPNYLPLILVGIFFATFLNMLIFRFIPDDSVVVLPLAFSFIATNIVGPIFEEVLFRYVFFNKLLTFNSKKATVLINCIAFSLIHDDLTHMFYAFLLGLIINYVYLKYKNIIACIVVHISANTIVSFLFGFNVYMLIVSFIGLILSLFLLYKDKINFVGV